MRRLPHGSEPSSSDDVDLPLTWWVPARLVPELVSLPGQDRFPGPRTWSPIEPGVRARRPLFEVVADYRDVDLDRWMQLRGASTARVLRGSGLVRGARVVTVVAAGRAPTGSSGSDWDEAHAIGSLVAARQDDHWEIVALDTYPHWLADTVALELVCALLREIGDSGESS